jgi:hypothetical protein
MKSKKQFARNGVVFEYSTVNLRDRLFKYDADEMSLLFLEPKAIKNACYRDLPDEALASLSVDCDAYSEWTDSLA